MLINRKIGSAYLIAIGAIAVLAILAGVVLRTSTERSYSTRFLSNEKKAEAVLESATDLLIAYAKFHMNNEDAPVGSHAKDFYNIFRFPAPMISGTMSNVGGENYRLEVANLPQISDLDTSFEALSPLSSMIDDLGADNVEMSMNCRIAQAEVFTSNVSGYEVAGISVRPAEASGRSARFLDSIDEEADSDGRLSDAIWAPSDWKADVKLPDDETKKLQLRVELGVLSKTFKVTIKLWRESPAVINFNINGGLTFLGKTLSINESFTFDLNEILNDVAIDLGKDDDGKQKEFSVQNIREHMMPGSDLYVSTLLYKASQLKSAIDSEYLGLPKTPAVSFETDDYSPFKLMIVEKGGIFEIEGNIAYKPRGNSSAIIRRKLVAHMPFKVSDVQPIAPEYSFFVANSDVMVESVPTNTTLGKAVNLSSTVGAFIVHNVPESNYSALTGLNSQGSDKYRQPGMLRINSNQVMSLNLALGNLNEPYTCSFNAIVSPWQKPSYTDQDAYKPLPVLEWDGESMTPDHEFDLPVIFESPDDMDLLPIIPHGLVNLGALFSSGLLTEGATLLFGKSHLEYPLGIRIEAPLDMVSSRSTIKVNPKRVTVNVDFEDISAILQGNVNIEDLDIKDNTEIYVDYKCRKHPYGILGYPPYDVANQWSPNITRNWPANAYSLMQYAKKATHFYETADDFFDDKDRKEDGVWNIDGVTYISGLDGLTISGPEFKVSGKGIIVVKSNIKISTNIRRVGEDTVFSLVARGGGLIIEDGCSEIEAACFSNRAPHTVTNEIVNIKGNLVVNEFDRGEITNLRVYYDGHACRTSPLSIMRDVGKFAPSRYYVSMAENWSRFGYEKIE